MHKTFYVKVTISRNKYIKRVLIKEKQIHQLKSLSNRLYFQYKFHKNRNNPQQTWNAICELITPIFQKVKSTISVLNTASGELIHPSAIANEFNNDLINISKEIASSHKTNRDSTKSTEYLLNI